MAPFLMAAPTRRLPKPWRTSYPALAKTCLSRSVRNLFLDRSCPTSSSRQRPSLFLLDACGVHRVAPQRRFAADQRSELGRRVAERIDADLVQPLDRARFARRLRHLLRNAVDDLFWRRGGSEQSVPDDGAKTRIKFGDRRDIGQLRRARLAGDRKQPDLAALRMLDQVSCGAEIHLHLTADEVGCRLRAFVGNVDYRQAGARGEQRRGQVADGTGPGRGVADLAGMRPHVVDEFSE